MIVQHSPNHYVFHVQMSEPSDIRSFNLYTDSEMVPPKKVIWDLFGTGDFYMNISSSKRVEEVHHNMTLILNRYFDASSTSSFSLNNPSLPVSPPDWARRAHDSLGTSYGFDGWMIDISLLFVLGTVKIPVSVCNYYTGLLPNGSRVTSSHYSFANEVIINCCSSPQLAKNKSQFVPCILDTSKHTSCPHYSSNISIISSASVFSHGSETPVIFQLSVSFKSDASVLYTVLNTDTNETVLTHAVSQRTEDSDNHAVEVFNELLSSYQDSLTKIKEDDPSPSQGDIVNSYLLSLV